MLSQRKFGFVFAFANKPTMSVVLAEGRRCGRRESAHGKKEFQFSWTQSQIMHGYQSRRRHILLDIIKDFDPMYGQC